MNFYVENKNISVGHIKVNGVSSASVLFVGDTEVITCASVFDTPPESIIIGPIVPLEAES